MIMYYLHFNRNPFYNRNLKVVAELVKKYPIIIPEGVEISDEFRQILVELTERDPTERIGKEEIETHIFIRE